MVPDDALEQRWIALAVPSAFRIDDGDRSAFANPKAVRFRAEYATLLRQPHLFQAPLQKIPCDESAIFVAAFRIRLIAAEKDVTLRHRHADAVRNRALFVCCHLPCALWPMPCRLCPLA